MKFNQKLAVAVIAASAGIFGMSSAALADTINRQTGVVNSPNGNTAAVIQLKNGAGNQPELLGVNAATGAGSATATGAIQQKGNAFSITGTAVGSDNKNVDVDTMQGDNDAAQENETVVNVGL